MPVAENQNFKKQRICGHFGKLCGTVCGTKTLVFRLKSRLFFKGAEVCPESFLG
jgi:hypothetical protein